MYMHVCVCVRHPFMCIASLECNGTFIPVHLIFPGSGSHSPFLVHTVVVGPVCISPGGPVRETLVLSSA